MKVPRCQTRSLATAAVLWCCIAVGADPSNPACLRAQVESHVLDQTAKYGPLSVEHEYFGFVYVQSGTIGSVVIQSSRCTNPDRCTLDTAIAAKQLPAGARILGEWHTHPQGGSTALSNLDVRGAHANRHLQCYMAFYMKPSGEIQSWDPDSETVPGAMATRQVIGNYHTLKAQ